MADSLRQRLLRDIAELQAKPYPNISLHVQDENITRACLVLTVEAYGHMHLTCDFPTSYPLIPPRIQMDSNVKHPNVHSDYICASILNSKEDYTPAYTLKAIAIQMLSFFSSDIVQQQYGGVKHLSAYREVQARVHDSFTCTKCGFGLQGHIIASNPVASSMFSSTFQTPLQDVSQWSDLEEDTKRSGQTVAPHVAYIASTDTSSSTDVLVPQTSAIIHAKLSDEILLLICDQLDTEEVVLFAQAWNKIGPLIDKYDFFRTRELQCFCLKKNYKTVALGVGVYTDGRSISSEFDLLSMEGFQVHAIRTSTQGILFQHWLPLPISHGHWRKVQEFAPKALKCLDTAPPAQVLFHFMTDIVIRLNYAAEQSTTHPPYYYHIEKVRSSLTHASEKAIESYFHIFHLLLCLATADPEIVSSANKMMNSFITGLTSKDDCPNLGHLLVAALISDVEMSQMVIKDIIKETITRNVVWMLKKNPELAYLEPTAVSPYRLAKTFEACKTSYRILMFQNLFRVTAVGNPRKPLAQLRDEAFDRHGAPPRGVARGLADSIKFIHSVNGFDPFFKAMGIDPRPSDEWLTGFLKECMEASRHKGYSAMPITQGEALTLREAKEWDVEVVKGLVREHITDKLMRKKNFFPQKGESGGDARGRGHGRG